MGCHTIVRTGLYSFAAGAALVLGGVAAPAGASPPAAVPALVTDCDVSGGQPGGEHAPGGHDGHGMTGQTPAGDGQMDHSMPMEDGGMDHSMPMEDGQMDHGGTEHGGMEHGGTEHGGHGVSAAAAAGPSDGTRQLVLGSFAGVNGAALVGAVFLRRRTASKRGRHLAARAGARPARSVVGGAGR